MGYTTEFEGELIIEPELSEKQRDELNLFCETRHGGDARPFDGMPGFWCDWETDGQRLFWNGSEKSYDMFEWLELLDRKFFQPWHVVLTGEITAQGERGDDVWAIRAAGGSYKKVRGRLVFEEE